MLKIMGYTEMEKKVFRNYYVLWLRHQQLPHPAPNLLNINFLQEKN